MQKNLIYVDIRSASQIDNSGNFVRATADFPCIERGQWQILCINFMLREVDSLGTITLNPVDVGGNSYLLVGDNNFDDTDNLMLKSYQSATPFDQHDPMSNRFNIEGDWIDGGTADPYKGQMSIRINADTVKFRDVTGSKESVTSGLYLQLKQYIAGIDNPSSIMRIRFCAKNTIRDWGESPENIPSNSQVVSIVDAYIKSGFEVEFSVDAITWHKQQEADDMYCRVRLRNSDAIWSDAIKMIAGPQGEPGKDGEPGPKGEQGERGAAFTIDATGTLEQRSQYDDATKDFSYLATDNGNVYIKQSDASGDWSDAIPFKGDKGDTGATGADGYTPIRGTDYWTETDIAEIKAYIDEKILNGEW